MPADAVFLSPPPMQQKAKSKSRAKPKAAAKPKAVAKPKATAESGEATMPEVKAQRTGGWTTTVQFDFLSARIPKYLEHQETRVVLPFLVAAADDFLEEFPSRAEEFSNRDDLIKVLIFFLSLRCVSHFILLRNFGAGTGITLVTWSTGVKIEPVSTSLGQPTANRFASKRLKHIRNSITTRVPS